MYDRKLCTGYSYWISSRRIPNRGFISQLFSFLSDTHFTWIILICTIMLCTFCYNRNIRTFSVCLCSRSTIPYQYARTKVADLLQIRHNLIFLTEKKVMVQRKTNKKSKKRRGKNRTKWIRLNRTKHKTREEGKNTQNIKKKEEKKN